MEDGVNRQSRDNRVNGVFIWIG